MDTIAGIIGIFIIFIAVIVWLMVILQSSSFGELFISAVFAPILIAIPTAIALFITWGAFELLKLIIQLF